MSLESFRVLYSALDGRLSVKDSPVPHPRCFGGVLVYPRVRRRDVRATGVGLTTTPFSFRKTLPTVLDLRLGGPLGVSEDLSLLVCVDSLWPRVPVGADETES